MKYYTHATRLALLGVLIALTHPPVARAAGSLQFDGSNDYVTFGAAPSLGATNFTLECWFKQTGPGRRAYTGTAGIRALPLVTKGMAEADGSNVDCNWFLGVGTNSSGQNVLAADFEDRNSGLNHPVVGTVLTASNVWQHAAVTYQQNNTNGTWVLYLNGVPDTTNTFSGTTNSITTPRGDSIQHAALGASLQSLGATNANSGFFAGVMDEVRVWNTARNAAQIAASYTNQLTSGTGLIGRWSLDEGTGTLISNSIAGGVQGTLANGPAWTSDSPFAPPVAPGIIGNTNQGTLTDGLWNNGDFLVAARFPAGSDLTVATMHAQVGAITGKYKCAIYSESNTLPSRLLRSTVEVNNPGTGWQSFALTSPLALTNGNYYWLAIWSDADNAQVYYTETPGTLRWVQTNYATAWPDPMNSTDGGAFNQAYCIYAASSPGAPPLTVTTTALPEGTVNQPYTATLSASGGTPAYTWSLASGALPAGLSLNTNSGTIAGTPTVAGSFPLTAAVRDSVGTSSTSAVLNLTVQAAGIGALLFDGSNDHVTFGASPGLGSTNFTIECWFKRTGAGATASTGTGGVTAYPLVTKGRGEVDQTNNLDMAWFLGLNTSGQLVADFEDWNSSLNHPVTGAAVAASNAWQHAAVTYDQPSGRWVLYLNGQPDATNVIVGTDLVRTPRADSIQHAALASALRSTGVPEGFFAGVLDEVRVWNYARNASQIATAYNSQIASAPGLLARWSLDDGAGTIVANSIAGGVNGTFVDVPVWTSGYFGVTGPPQVSISSPINGNTLNTNAFLVEAAATASAGRSITNVAIFGDGAKLADDTNAPYSTLWSGVADGAHTLWAVAADNTGATSTSAVVNVTVLASGVGALFFDGVNDYTTFGPAPALGLTKFTIECWFKKLGPGADTTTGSGGVTDAIPLVSKGRGENEAGATNMNWFFGLNTSGKLVADFEDTVNGGNHPVLGTTTVPVDQWTHGAVTYDGSNWVLYLNGLSDGTLLVPSNNTPESASIQHAALASALTTTGAADGFFHGLLDEVRVWNYARSQSEIQSTRTIQVTSAPGLVGRWSLNEGVGTVVGDTSGNNVQGSLVNSPLWVTGFPFAPGSNLPPAVVITSPPNGATFPILSPVSIVAQATDYDGSVVRVDFYAGGNLIGTDTNSPFGLNWSNAVAATYPLSAVALDDDGLSATSAVVNVTLQTVNLPPQITALVSPTNGASGLGASNQLRVAVSDPEGASLSVTFHGRPYGAAPGPDFTLVALPDTQFYCSSLNGGLPAMFTSQTDWITSNRLSRNIQYVAQLGDCVQNGDNGGNNVEWLVATNALYRLENPVATQLPDGVPYGVAVGNHDQSPIADATGTTTFYNQYFGTNHFSGFGYYGGHYGTNNDNHYDLFSAAGMDFIVIYFEYDSTMTTGSPVIAWANNLLQTHANRRALVVSHWIINSGFNATFGAQGQAIYDGLKANPNLFLTLSGHVTTEGQRTNIYQGRTVWNCMSDYQGRTGGGSGWLRLYEFSPANNVIRVKTYSPWLNQSETDADSQFEIPYDMSGGAGGFTALGTVNGVPSGSEAALQWTNLAPATLHEWYVTVSDGVSVTTGPIWQFTTAGGVLPTVTLTNPAAGAVFESPASVLLEASAADTDNGVSKVEFLANGSKLGEDFTAPYALLSSGLAAGSYSLNAVAVDAGGLRATSAPVSISVITVPKTTNVVVAAGAVWKYLDNGSDQGTAWRAPTFNDLGWSSGPAKLGYGDTDVVTTVSFGPSSTNKYVTTYFRHAFPVEQAGAVTSLLLRVLRDDGAVVYLNDSEIFRSNMPLGPAGYQTFASTVVSSTEETAWFTAQVQNTNLLVSGTNVLAAEIHQANVTSSDIGFNFELSTIANNLVNLPPVASNLTVQLPADAPANLTLAASDPNGDPLTFSLVSQPVQGLLSGFNPGNGTVTYTPAHGFVGADSFQYQAADTALTSATATVTLNVQALPDGDGDGLPDAWESQYGVTDPNADNDLDGMRTLAEYRANTIPTNATSVLKVISTTVNTSKHATFTWQAVGGTRYRVLYSDTSPATAYVPLVRTVTLEMAPGAPGVPTSLSFTDDFTLTGGPPTNRSRFYRIQIIP